MTSLRKHLRIYLPFSKSIVQILMSYRINFFMFVFGDLLKTFVIYYLWKAVFLSSSSSSINGFTIENMIIYVFISSLTAGVMQGNTDGAIGQEVRQGTIAMNLIRPINYQVRMLFEALGNSFYNILFVGIPLWLGLILIRFFYSHEFPPSLSTVALYFVSLALGFIIMFLFNFCFGLIAFYVTNMWGVSHLKDAIIRFFSGEIIPIAFFPLALQKVVSFIPFSSMNYIPVMVYLNKLNGSALLQALLIQIFWVIFLIIVSRWLWNRAMDRLTILGG